MLLSKTDRRSSSLFILLYSCRNFHSLRALHLLRTGVWLQFGTYEQYGIKYKSAHFLFIETLSKILRPYLSIACRGIDQSAMLTLPTAIRTFSVSLQRVVVFQTFKDVVPCKNVSGHRWSQPSPAIPFRLAHHEIEKPPVVASQTRSSGKTVLLLSFGIVLHYLSHPSILTFNWEFILHIDFPFQEKNQRPRNSSFLSANYHSFQFFNSLLPVSFWPRIERQPLKTSLPQYFIIVSSKLNANAMYSAWSFSAAYLWYDPHPYSSVLNRKADLHLSYTTSSFQAQNSSRFFPYLLMIASLLSLLPFFRILSSAVLRSSCCRKACLSVNDPFLFALVQSLYYFGFHPPTHHPALQSIERTQPEPRSLSSSLAPSLLTFELTQTAILTALLQIVRSHQQHAFLLHSRQVSLFTVLSQLSSNVK